MLLNNPNKICLYFHLMFVWWLKQNVMKRFLSTLFVVIITAYIGLSQSPKSISEPNSYAKKTDASSKSLADFTPETYVLICQSKTAKAYHSHNCKGLDRCTHEIVKVTLEEAQQMGRTPCGFCYK